MQMYPLQVTDIPDWPLDKIAADLIMDLNVLTPGNQHILTHYQSSYRVARNISNS